MKDNIGGEKREEGVRVKKCKEGGGREEGEIERTKEEWEGTGENKKRPMDRGRE